ncbi:dihydrolipoamide acetyltransferase family protein [Halobacillus sp. MO56]
MAVDVQMPKMGATMETGKIIAWLKEEGDPIENGEPILEIMTDKINIEVEASASGILLRKLYEEDTDVPVLKTIAYIGEPGEEIPEPKNEASSEEKEPVEVVNEKDGKEEADIDSNSNVKHLTMTKPRRTPAARKLAESHQIDLQQVQGSGPNGRIHVKDVEAYMQHQKKSTSLAERVAASHGLHTSEIQTYSDTDKVKKEDVLQAMSRPVDTSVDYDGLRKSVGENMQQSTQTAPHVTLTTQVDMTEAINLRKQLIDKIQKNTGYRLSYTEIIVKSVARTLASHPMINASLQGERIDVHSSVNIGLAVAIPNGLVVPVIKHANKKGLASLTEESKRLARRARDNQLTPDDMTGGTFTISNLGMYAVDSFTPIINPGQSAILGVGRIREEVVSVDGNVETRPQLTLSLSFDHRVVDGAPAAHFLTDLKETLETPYELIM